MTKSTFALITSLSLPLFFMGPSVQGAPLKDPELDALIGKTELFQGTFKELESHKNQTCSPFDVARDLSQADIDTLIERASSKSVSSKKLTPEQSDLAFIESIEFQSPFKEGPVEIWREYQIADFHAGFDLITKGKDKALVAAAKGKVVKSDFSTSFGNRIIIELDPSPDFKAPEGFQNKYYLHYAHLKSASKLKPGDVVEAGDSLGVMGETGHADGAHLHIELLRDYPLQGMTGPYSLNPQAFPRFYESMTGIPAKEVKTRAPALST